MTEFVSSLLTQLILAFAASMAGLLDTEPQRADAEPPPVRALVVVAESPPSAGVRLGLQEVRTCSEPDASCAGARMRWQLTLPAASMKRCPNAACIAG